MDILMDSLKVFGRIITILPLLLGITLFMGRRSIGELPVFDFLIIITLGAVVGADIADPDIAHIHTGVAIILLGIFQRIVSSFSIKHRKFGRLITFEPTVIIQNGEFLVSNLKKLRYSIDNILQMLREKDVFDISDVYLAIIEANGNISILKKSDKSSENISLSYPIIIDGVLYEDVLQKLNLSKSWLTNKLSNINVHKFDDIFFASVSTKNELHVSLKNKNNKDDIFPIYH